MMRHYVYNETFFSVEVMVFSLSVITFQQSFTHLACFCSPFIPFRPRTYICMHTYWSLQFYSIMDLLNIILL